MKFIGREYEIKILNDVLKSTQSEIDKRISLAIARTR